MRPTPEQLQTALTVADQSRPPHYVAVLAAEVRALHRDLMEAREHVQLFRAASESAELRIVELREELKFTRARADDSEATIRRLVATLVRVEALCDMQHDDRLILVSDIRAALRDEP